MENITRNKFNPLKVAKASWKYGSFVYVFLFMFIIYVIMNPYLNWGGIMTILTHTAVVGTIALGMGLIIISGDIDLSVGSIFAFAGGIGILTYNKIVETTGNVAAGMIVTLIVIVAISAFIGFLNGFMVGKIKMPAFIATLGTMLIFRSLCKFILKSIPMAGGGQQQTYQVFEYFNSPFFTLGNGKLATIPIVGFILIIMTLIVFYFAKHTKFGRKVYALGSNPRASSLAGINVPWTKVIIFTLAGVLVGIAAFLHVGIYGSMDSSTAGMSYELYAIASCVIGGIAMTGGRGNIIGILFGAMAFQIIDKIISVAGLNPLINDTIKGSILLAAVVLQVIIIDKDKINNFLQRIGLVFNPELDQVLEGELRKKVNQVKLAYDKKMKKILANKAIGKEEGERLVNELLDQQDAEIINLNAIYALKIDNARLKTKEVLRAQGIKAQEQTVKNNISDGKYSLKVTAKNLKKEHTPMLRPVLDMKLEGIQQIYDTYVSDVEKLHELRKDVAVLKDNAQHVLDRDLLDEKLKVNAQANFDKKTQAIAIELEKADSDYETAKETSAQLVKQALDKVNAEIKANEANEEAQKQANAGVLKTREAKAAEKQAKLDAKKAKADVKAEAARKVAEEDQARQDYLDKILKDRGAR